MKKIHFNVDANNRVEGVSSSPEGYQYTLDVPENHEVHKNPFVFKYENNGLVKDSAYQKHLETLISSQASQPSLEKQVAELRKQTADLAFELMMKGVL
jgi:hypothetical protein